jgi:Tfp pilus assembly major pilin PilA
MTTPSIVCVGQTCCQQGCHRKTYAYTHCLVRITSHVDVDAIQTKRLPSALSHSSRCVSVPFTTAPPHSMACCDAHCDATEDAVMVHHTHIPGESAQIRSLWRSNACSGTCCLLPYPILEGSHRLATLPEPGFGSSTVVGKRHFKAKAIASGIHSKLASYHGSHPGLLPCW